MLATCYILLHSFIMISWSGLLEEIFGCVSVVARTFYLCTILVEQDIFAIMLKVGFH